jgi:hypothetical protein
MVPGVEEIVSALKQDGTIHLTDVEPYDDHAAYDFDDGGYCDYFDAEATSFPRLWGLLMCMQSKERGVECSFSLLVSMTLPNSLIRICESYAFHLLTCHSFLTLRRGFLRIPFLPFLHVHKG